MHAWETADVSGLVALLKEDASFAMPPSTSWYRGHAAIQTILAAEVFGAMGRGEWRMASIKANLQPAFVLYVKREGAAQFTATGIQLLTIDRSIPAEPKVSDITTFLMPELVSRFGLPQQLSE